MKLRYLSQYFTYKQVNELFKRVGKIQITTAPTGAGKSTFIIENVIKIAKGEFKPFGASDKKALFLANRSALLKQVEKDLEDNLVKTKFDNIVEEIYVNEYIDILSYQVLTNKILEDPNFLDKYKLIIADECHYFLNDSWNNTTQLVLDRVIEHSINNTVLFFSATTEELKSFLNTIKDISYDGRELYEEVLSDTVSKALGFNDRLDIIVTDSELKDVMNRIPSNEKFVIFVNELFSKEQIEELSDEYSKDNRFVGFLYSKWEQVGRGYKENKDMTERFNNVLEKEGFYDEDMLGLIANNAVDNGINFKMEDLKHIILLNQYDFIQIRQFIGRKRHSAENENDRTNVYIISHNKNDLYKIKSKSEKTINYYKDYENLSKEEFMDKYRAEISIHSVFVPSYENSYIEGLKIRTKISNRVNTINEFPFMITFNLVGDVEIHPNYCQIQKSQTKLSIINSILEQIKCSTMASYFKINLEKYYPNIKLEEVNKTKTQKQYSAKDEIPVYLEKIKGNVMDKEEYKNLRIDFKDRWNIRDSRNGRVLGDKAFNEELEKFGYCILKGKGKKVNNTVPVIYTIIKI